MFKLGTSALYDQATMNGLYLKEIAKLVKDKTVQILSNNNDPRKTAKSKPPTDIPVQLLHEIVVILNLIDISKESSYDDMHEFPMFLSRIIQFALSNNIIKTQHGLTTECLKFLIISFECDFFQNVRLTTGILQIVFDLMQCDKVLISQGSPDCEQYTKAIKRQIQAVRLCATILKSEWYNVLALSESLLTKIILECSGMLQYARDTGDSRIENVIAILASLATTITRVKLRKLFLDFGIITELIPYLAHKCDNVRSNILTISYCVFIVPGDKAKALPILQSNLLTYLHVVFIQSSVETIEQALWLLVHLITCHALDILPTFSFVSYFPSWLKLVDPSHWPPSLWLLKTYLERANMDLKRELLLNDRGHVVTTIIRQMPHWKQTIDIKGYETLILRLAILCLQQVVHFMNMHWQEREDLNVGNVVAGSESIGPSNDLFWLVFILSRNECKSNLSQVTGYGVWFESKVSDLFKDIGKFKLTSQGVVRVN